MPQKKDKATEPTEMEATVLGALWQKGPCTAYAIRKEFMESLSPRWSGSSGAIYPLLKRMELGGLVDAMATNRGKRKQRDYRITKKGLTVFRRWLRNLKPEVDAALMHDPLRSKLFFIDAMTNDQARTFVKKAMEELKGQIGGFHKFSAHNTVAGRNMLLVTKARIKWLEEVLDQMEI